MGTNPDFWKPRTVPTMYFIGVTTAQSSTTRVFPRWSEILGLGARLEGYDAPIHAPTEVYRAIVRHIRADPLSRGALITTHKIDLLEAARDLFDNLYPDARVCGEVSAIVKSDGRLLGLAIDPRCAGLAWEAFVPPGHWGRIGGHVLCLGAGGAAVAICVYLARHPDPADRPRKLIVVNRSPGRLDRLRAILERLGTDMDVVFVRNEDPAANDALVAALPPGSLVINATGMGKDTPGSPLTDAARFPERGLAWELNYRGELDFLRQARRQAAARGLHVEDGWTYFLHGWARGIAEVFHLELTQEQFAELAHAATDLRPSRLGADR